MIVPMIDLMTFGISVRKIIISMLESSATFIMHIPDSIFV